MVFDRACCGCSDSELDNDTEYSSLVKVTVFMTNILVRARAADIDFEYSTVRNLFTVPSTTFTATR